MSEPKAEPIPVAFIVERLRQAHENSQQRILGSDIFEEAADCLEALSEAVDTLGSRLETERKAMNDAWHEQEDELQALRVRLDALQKEHEALTHDHERLFARDTANLNRLIECQRRLGTCVEALECLLPGLVFDLRYADPDDDKDAMRSRIETVTEALNFAAPNDDAAPSAPSEGEKVDPYTGAYGSCVECGATPPHHEDGCSYERPLSEGEKPSLRCGAIANDLVGQCIFADGHSGEHRYGSREY